MKTRSFLMATFLLLAMTLAACAGQQAAASTEAPKQTEAGPTEAQRAPVTEMTSLVDAIRAAGATVEPDQPVEQPFFSVKGDILKVNGADVQVFEYNTAEEMEADAAKVAPDGGSIGTSMVSWMEPPHFYKAGRIIVLYVGQDQAVLDLLNAVLGLQFAGR
jgi:hypothetical protein